MTDLEGALSQSLVLLHKRRGHGGIPREEGSVIIEAETGAVNL